ncbi:MAG: (Fe-S)-binding protein [Saccharofermentanales bacterium]
MDIQMQKDLEILFRTKLNAAMRLYLETCTHCGVCVDACHVYHSMPETRYTAVGRAEIVRKVFLKYFKMEGKIAPWLGEVIELDDVAVDRMYDAAYSCTGCRRCMVYCPFGIDTQQIMSIAKLLLVGADKEPKLLSMLADMSIAKGEDVESSQAGFEQAIAGIEPEVEALWETAPGRRTIPIGVENADVMFVGLSGKHSIVPAAAILNAAGINWTLSSFEAVNFGAFVGDPARTRTIAGRIIAEAERLKVKEVAIVECGTAYRVMKQQTGAHSFEVVAFIELVARYIREGKIHLDKTVADKITYHDPCQVARNGGVYEDPRFVLNALAEDFVEATPNREMNWCCGGGGGLVAMGELEFRMKSSKVKVDQIRNTGAAVICTICENCHSQLTDLNEYYNMGMKVESLTNLAAHALKK